MGIGNVAYTAHLAGYAYGFAAGLAMLLLRLVPAERHDVLSILRRARGAAAARAPATGHGHDDGHGRAEPPTAAEMGLRAEIARLLREGRDGEAADAYVRLSERDPGAVLPLRSQLAVANQLMQDQSHAAAADAYERLMRAHAGYDEIDRVRLILGLLYGRYLGQPDRARQLLNLDRSTLQPADRALADEVLAEIEARRIDA